MFRKIGKSKIGILLAILFGISLLFFRSGSQYSNIFNSDNVVASVSGTKISTTKFVRTLQMNINQFSQMFGRDITDKDIRALQIPSLALSALIHDAVFENEYDKKNFKLDKKLIALKTKEKLPNLYEGNKLNEMYLNEFLKSQQLKIEDIVQIINFETRNEFFDKAFLEIDFPNSFSEKINAYENHKRVIKYIKLPIDLLNDDIIIDTKEENLRNYYNENLNLYMDKEKRDVEYLIIDKNKILEDFAPNDFDISEYYENNKKLFFEKERRSFLQFNFNTLEKAESFKEKIKFINNYLEVEKFANENGIMYNIFEELSYQDLLEEIANPLFNLQINQKSKIIETNIAKHIIILKSIKKESQLSFNEVKNQITDKLIEIEKNNNFDTLKEEINQSIIDGKSILNISKDLNLGELNYIEALTQNFTNFDQNESKFYNDLIKNSFATSKDFVSDIIDLDENSFYIFNVKKINEEKALKFENIKEKILNDYKYAIKTKSIDKLFEENVNNKNFVNSQSNLFGINLESYEINNKSKKFSKAFISKIFGQDINTNVYFIEKNEVHFANIDKIIIENNNIDTVAIPLKNDLKGSLSNELMKNIKISTNDRLINALIDRY